MGRFIVICQLKKITERLTSKLLFSLVLLTVAALTPTVSLACSDCEYEACVWKACACFPKSGCILPKPLNDVLVAVVPPPRLVVTTFEKAVEDIGKTIAKAFDDTVRTIDKAGKDVERNVDKAGKDTEGEFQRFGLELESAGRGIGKYVEGQKKIFSEIDLAVQRTREGKVIDALWHAALSPIVVQEHSASEAVLESAYLRAIGQTAATAYGGPQGAAAYAAWITYKQTGDPSLALRAGLITGASAWLNGQAAQIPDTAKRVLVTAAIGGTVVAAAGGSEAAVKEAFLQAGAMVIIQDGYKRYTTHKMDPTSSSDVPAYCISAIQTGCTPLPDGAILEKDAQGNLLKVDMTKVDPKVPAVGKKDHTALFQEKHPAMVATSKIPGMQAMAVFHDQWAVDWNMGALSTPATILPAIVVTYMGFGAPYYENVRSTVVESVLNGSNAGNGLTDVSAPTKRGSSVQSLVRFGQGGSVELAVTQYRRRSDTALWCGGPNGKNLFKQKKKLGSIEIETHHCIAKRLGGIVFDRPNYDIDAAALVTVTIAGKEQHICSSLFVPEACDGVAERYVEANATNVSVWYRAEGRAIRNLGSSKP
jgi:hypothetical protein